NCGDKEWLETFPARHSLQGFYCERPSSWPPALPANLLEKMLLTNTREASRSSVTSPIVDTRGCKLRRSANGTVLGQLDGLIEPVRTVGGCNVDEQFSFPARILLPCCPHGSACRRRDPPRGAACARRGCRRR